MLALALIGGLALALNFIIILHKFRRDKYEDGILDLGAAFIMSLLFAGTMVGMAIAMVGSLIFSAYLWFFPVESENEDSNTPENEIQGDKL